RKCFHVAEILDGFDDAFLDAEAAVFNPTEWGIFDTKPGNFVDVDRAAFEFAHGSQGQFEVVGDDARTEAVFGAVGDGHGVVEILDANDRGEGSETFAHYHWRSSRHMIDDGGLEQGAATFAASQNLCAFGDG